VSLLAATETPYLDPDFDLVFSRLEALAAPDPAIRFGAAIRQSIDEVLDGPRTGRWSFAQLEKTEKTYVGTKLEIVVRAFLGLERGGVLDLDIEGHPVDIKWAMNSSWQIPEEAVDQLCLCVGGMRKLSRFQVGLVRCRGEYLNLGSNRDRKTTLTAADRDAAMKFLVPPTPLPQNFVAEMDDAVRAEVMAEPTIQTRVTKLFTLLTRTPIPRDAIATVARTTGDPMRRVRADAWAGDPLDGVRILSAKYGNAVIEALGYPRLGPREFMSIPHREIDGLSERQRRALPQHVRTRLAFD
jgi:plasmid stabilization system protein ParE